MDQLAATIRSAIQRHHMLAPGDLLVVAVSGGPDSLCLLHALHTFGLRLHVAHLDHTLRGAESAAEAAFVAEVAEQLGVPATVEAVDVGGLAQAERANLSATARDVRYRFLQRVAINVGAPSVAVAHHADDQAETVLLHLLRGAGPAGLSGMRPVTALGEGLRLIRPLLDVTRAEIEAYCQRHALLPRRDPSNDDRRYARSRVRHDLLPHLIEYNPRIVAALTRTARAAAEEHDFIIAALDAVWPSLADRTQAGWVFDGVAWSRVAPALRREVIRRAHALLAGEETLGLEDVERALALAGGPVGKRAELPGGLALVNGYGGSFTIGTPIRPAGPQLSEDVALAVPDEVALAEGWRLVASAEVAGVADGWEIYLIPRDEPLGVRRRQPGDRMRPAGGSGSRLVQDILTDAHIPRKLRDAWPFVTVGGQIAWAPGIRPGEGYVAAKGEMAIRIRIEPPETLEPLSVER